MTQLRKDVLNRLIDCVVVYRLDRISRKTVDTLSVVQVEWENLCHLVSATEPISTLNGMAEIVLPIMSTVGEMDRNRIIANTKAGRYAAVRKGRNVGKPPYGYQRGTRTGEIEVCEGEAAVVRRIFREYLAGSGLTTLCGMLNRDGIPSPQGTTWSPNSVGLILKNEAYMGRLLYAKNVVNPRKRRHKEERRYLPNDEPIVVEGVFPRLVSDEDFGAAQRLRQGRADRHRGRRALNSQHLLTGLTRCANCGYTVVGITNAQGYRYYACQGKLRQRTDCDCKLIRGEDLDAQVLPEVRRGFPIESCEQLVETVLQQRTVKLAEAQATFATVSADLQKVRSAKAKWLEAFEQGTIDPSLVNDRLRELTTQEVEKRLALDQALRNVRLGQAQIDNVHVTALVKAAQALDVWDSITFEQQKHLLRYFVREILVYVSARGEKRLEIVLNTATPVQ